MQNTLLAKCAESLTVAHVLGLFGFSQTIRLSTAHSDGALSETPHDPIPSLINASLPDPSSHLPLLGRAVNGRHAPYPIPVQARRHRTPVRASCI